MTELEINPKLLDVVRVGASNSAVGEERQGTVVLDEPPGMALIEVADEFGVAHEFVLRPASELERVSDVSASSVPRPETPEAQQLFETGVLYLQNGLIARAKEHLSKAFSADQKLARNLLNKTNSLAEGGAFHTAIFVYEILLELLPRYDLARENLAITLLNRGIASAHQGFFPKAIDDFDKALMARPSASVIEAVRKNSVAAYSNWGILCASTNQYREALRLLQWALELDPSSETVRKNLALTMIALSVLRTEVREPPTKEDIFRQPLMMGLTLSECLNAYGATLGGLGKLSEAKRALQDAIEADPQNETARKNLDALSTHKANQVFAVGLVRFPIQKPHRVNA